MSFHSFRPMCSECSSLPERLSLDKTPIGKQRPQTDTSRYIPADPFCLLDSKALPETQVFVLPEPTALFQCKLRTVRHLIDVELKEHEALKGASIQWPQISVEPPAYTMPGQIFSKKKLNRVRSRILREFKEQGIYFDERHVKKQVLQAASKSPPLSLLEQADMMAHPYSLLELKERILDELRARAYDPKNAKVLQMTVHPPEYEIPDQYEIDPIDLRCMKQYISYLLERRAIEGSAIQKHNVQAQPSAKPSANTKIEKSVAVPAKAPSLTWQQCWDYFQREIDAALRVERTEVHGFVCPASLHKDLKTKVFEKLIRIFQTSRTLFETVRAFGGGANMHAEVIVEGGTVRIGSARLPRDIWHKIVKIHRLLRTKITEGLTRAEGKSPDNGPWASTTTKAGKTLQSYYDDTRVCFNIFMHRLLLQTLHVDGKRLVTWMTEVASGPTLKPEAQAFDLRFGSATVWNGRLRGTKYSNSGADVKGERVSKWFGRADIPCLGLFSWNPSEQMMDRVIYGEFDAQDFVTSTLDIFENYVSLEPNERSDPKAVIDKTLHAFRQARIPALKEKTGVVVFPLTVFGLVGIAAHWEFLVESGAPYSLRGFRQTKAQLQTFLKWRCPLVLIGRVRKALFGDETNGKMYALSDILPQQILILPTIREAKGI